MSATDDEDKTIYKVVVNHEEQYSIWPEYRDNPPGWRDAGKSGPKADCLAYIKEVWTDMRPLSLRKKMEEAARRSPAPETPSAARPSEADRGDDLISRLSTGRHRIEVSLRPERTARAFKDCLDRGFVLVKFLDTRGGTELGMRLDRAACEIAGADFDAGTGNVHLEADLTLDYVRVRCIADIEIAGLSGQGHLRTLEAKSSAA
jgi:uncharacterized protein YbdZ (MbtH family)